MSKVYVEAGHGLPDPGAVGYVKEYAVAIKVVNAFYDHLVDNYVGDFYKDISSDSINTIVNRANKWGANLFVSIHFNAGGGDGFEALVYSAKNKALGQAMTDGAKKAGQNLRSPAVKYRPDLGVLRLTNCKAVLCEVAFVDNKRDISDWDEDAELKKMGVALAEAAAGYLKLKKKTSKTKKSVTTIAREVIAGKWGNGAERKTKLEKAGYNYDEVQAEVRRLLKK